MNVDLTRIMQRYWGIKKVPHDLLTKEFLRRCQSDLVEFNGNSYRYHRQGRGPTVVLVHGLHSNLGSMVPIAQDLLAEGFEVVLFDAPAHGEAVGRRTDPVEVREVIRKISQRLGEIHAIVCHSVGGIWALSAWNSGFHAKTVVTIASPSTQEFLLDKFVQVHQLKKETADCIVKELESRFGPTVWTDLSPAEIVKKIGAPGLIIHAENDEFVPLAHAEQLHCNWSNAKMAIVEGAGHVDVIASVKARGLISNHLREL